VGIFGVWVVIEGGGGEVVLRRGIGLGHGLVEGDNRLGDGFKGGGGGGEENGSCTCGRWRRVNSLFGTSMRWSRWVCDVNGKEDIHDLGRAIGRRKERVLCVFKWEWCNEEQGEKAVFGLSRLINPVVSDYYPPQTGNRNFLPPSADDALFLLVCYLSLSHLLISHVQERSVECPNRSDHHTSSSGHCRSSKLGVSKG